MKRDWDLLREQLLAIEEDRDFETEILGSVCEAPSWEDDQTEAEQAKALSEYRKSEARIFGHLEMLVDNGYIDGVTIHRSHDGFHYGLTHPRLTMAGHDLLNHMRSQEWWEKTKSFAISRGIELTVESVKGLGALMLKSVLGS